MCETNGKNQSNNIIISYIFLCLSIGSQVSTHKLTLMSNNTPTSFSKRKYRLFSSALEVFFKKRDALYKSTFYLLTYLLTIIMLKINEVTHASCLRYRLLTYHIHQLLGWDQPANRLSIPSLTVSPLHPSLSSHHLSSIEHKTVNWIQWIHPHWLNSQSTKYIIMSKNRISSFNSQVNSDVK